MMESQGYHTDRVQRSHSVLTHTVYARETSKESRKIVLNFNQQKYDVRQYNFQMTNINNIQSKISKTVKKYQPDSKQYQKRISKVLNKKSQNEIQQQLKKNQKYLHSDIYFYLRQLKELCQELKTFYHDVKKMFEIMTVTWKVEVDKFTSNVRNDTVKMLRSLGKNEKANENKNQKSNGKSVRHSKIEQSQQINATRKRIQKSLNNPQEINKTDKNITNTLKVSYSSSQKFDLGNFTQPFYHVLPLSNGKSANQEPQSKNTRWEIEGDLTQDRITQNIRYKSRNRIPIQKQINNISQIMNKMIDLTLND